MSDFLQQAAQLAPGLNPPGSAAWLQPLRESGKAQWLSSRLPTRKTEAWKYTSIQALEQGDLLAAPAGTKVDQSLAAHYEIAGLESCRIVFVNGRYQADLSAEKLPEGVRLVRFADADKQTARTIEANLNSTLDSGRHLFAALNQAWLDDGLLLEIKAKKTVVRPLQIVWLTTAQDQGFSLAQRLLVLAGEGSQASLIEHFASTDAAQNSFTNGVTELVLAPGARLQHYRLNLEEEHAIHIGGVHAQLDRDARLDSFYLALGSQLKRLDVVVHHRGEGAHSEIKGVYLPRREQMVDFHTSIEHEVPHCTSNEVFRGIISDRARAVFNGRIHIHPDAQKTQAQLSNKNLLTSPDAEVNTKPELEIYADDVQCAHGATVAQIDERSLYYLCSRGISRQEAEVMLSFGFINELINQLSLPELGNYLRPLLARSFAENPELRKHVA